MRKIMKLTDILETLTNIQAEIIFELKEGSIAETLLANVEKDNIALFTYLLGAIHNSEYITDEHKLFLMSLMTIGLNITIYGEIPDEVRES